MLFYFHYLKDYRGGDEHFWSHSYGDPSRRAWAELSFEQICMDHISQIKQKLGISGVLTDESSWFAKEDEEKGIEKGAQIDLVIDRKDHVINICEIKFSSDIFIIDASYSKSLRSKVEVFRRATLTKKTLNLTMVTTFGVKQNKYSGMVNQQVILDDLFEKNEM